MHNCYSLSDALAEFSIVLNYNEVLIQGELCNDSRVLQPQDVFCAVNGSQEKGQKYIEQAIAKGVAYIICECENINEHGNIEIQDAQNESGTVTLIYFYQLSFHLFALAKVFYKAPQDKLTVIGVTGTNGKTSTCQLIARLLEYCEQKSAVIGTTGYGKLAKLTPIQNTTPGPTQLHKILKELTDSNIEQVAMEVSSHALSQHRVNSQLFDIAIFTNLSRDHLDYHQTMQAYAQAKYQIFSHRYGQRAILNGDDLQAKKWLEKWQSEKAPIVYGRSESINSHSLFVRASNIKHNTQGVSFTVTSHLGDCDMCSPLLGDFNIDNLLAAIAVMLELSFSLEVIKDAVSSCSAIIGRMEPFSAANKAIAVVDYAHTPEALLNALRACREHCQGKLWVVFGCGGNRDQGKRSLMGSVAESNADKITLTNDNPRNESPEVIINDILTGCKFPDRVMINLDRKEAVKSVLSQAGVNDIVLLAGKGHEENITVDNQTILYNEREFVQATYAAEALS